ncbi:hypothetical protein MRX60_06225 [Xylella fastidiosa subsp. pauca]|nr:hypothetical protein [Xylella fastidiosa subsp. pauca]
MARHRSKEHALVSSSRPIRIFVNIRHADCKLHLALAYLPEAFPGHAGSGRQFTLAVVAVEHCTGQ